VAREIRASQLKTADIPSPPIVPSARAADAADIRATLPVGVESAVRSAIAVAGAPFALSMGTALRQEQNGGRKDHRDNEYSRHDFNLLWLVMGLLDRSGLASPEKAANNNGMF
jgi:hypothetical protein